MVNQFPLNILFVLFVQFERAVKMSLKSGHTIVKPEGRLKELCDLFEMRGPTVLLTPGNWAVFGAIDKYGDKYYDFKVRELIFWAKS